MSCNGCRVLRKGCSDSCVLRPCLQWIDGPDAQGNATLFVAKFFGRAALLSFISAVPLPHRPALFQSLLFEACGRTVNPVNGAVGLLWSGNWHVCHTAVETVLRGGMLEPAPELPMDPCEPYGRLSKAGSGGRSGLDEVEKRLLQASDLDLCLRSGSSPAACGETDGDRKLLNLFG
ncbi:LOB domain-containing protein 38 [Asimina triloba]